MRDGRSQMDRGMHSTIRHSVCGSNLDGEGAQKTDGICVKMVPLRVIPSPGQVSLRAPIAVSFRAERGISLCSRGQRESRFESTSLPRSFVALRRSLAPSLCSGPFASGGRAGSGQALRLLGMTRHVSCHPDSDGKAKRQRIWYPRLSVAGLLPFEI